MSTFEEIIKTQKTLQETYSALKKSFEKAEKDFQVKQSKILAAFEAEQRQEAESLALIGKALERIMTRGQI